MSKDEIQGCDSRKPCEIKDIFDAIERAKKRIDTDYFGDLSHEQRRKLHAELFVIRQLVELFAQDNSLK